MARHPHWGALPDKRTLEAEFVRGETYGQLGRKYGVRPQTVLSTMKRRALRDGTAWPLKQGSPRLRLQRQLNDPRWDSVSALLIRGELDESCATYGVTLRGIACLARVGERTVYEVHAGSRARISRATAHKLMAAIESIERDAEGIAA